MGFKLIQLRNKKYEVTCLKCNNRKGESLVLNSSDEKEAIRLIKLHLESEH